MNETKQKKPEHPAVTEAKKRVVAVRRVSRAVEGLTYADTQVVFQGILDALRGSLCEAEDRTARSPASNQS